MGMFGALSAVLMLFDFPIPFIAPSFYTLDLSEVPVLIGTFSLGPVAGAVIELVKILVKLVLKPTSTGFVGEFANVCVGCSLILPAGLIYQFKKTKKGAIVGMVAGTIIMAVVGAVLNALVMLPFYSTLAIRHHHRCRCSHYPGRSATYGPSVFLQLLLILVKGFIVSLITALIYKRVSIIIHAVR